MCKRLNTNGRVGVEEGRGPPVGISWGSSSFGGKVRPQDHEGCPGTGCMWLNCALCVCSQGSQSRDYENSRERARCASSATPCFSLHSPHYCPLPQPWQSTQRCFGSRRVRQLLTRNVAQQWPRRRCSSRSRHALPPSANMRLRQCADWSLFACRRHRFGRMVSVCA